MERPHPAQEYSKEHENFRAQAEDIFMTIRRAESEDKPKREGYETARQAYIIEEDDPELRKMSEVLLDAPAAYEASKRLGEIKAQPSPDLSEVRKLKNDLITYNHKLRDFVFANADHLSEKELGNWLERASGSNAVWARSLLAGISAEVAAAISAESIPGVKQVALSSVEEDAKGVDLKVMLQDGRKVKVDIKYGGQEPLGGVMKRGDRVELGIGKGAVENFKLKKQYEAELVASFKKVI